MKIDKGTVLDICLIVGIICIILIISSNFFNDLKRSEQQLHRMYDFYSQHNPSNTLNYAQWKTLYNGNLLFQTNK